MITTTTLGGALAQDILRDISIVATGTGMASKASQPQPRPFCVVDTRTNTYQ